MLREDASPKPLEWEPGHPPKWIPIELGLPGEGEIVIVTTKSGYITLGFLSNHWDYVDDEEGGDIRPIYYIATEATDYVNPLVEEDEPIAWAYLPIPYSY